MANYLRTAIQGERVNGGEMKNHEAHLEIQHIECHLRNLVTPEQLESAGATITPGRPPHIRVMRIISYLQDALASAGLGESADCLAQREAALTAAREALEAVEFPFSTDIWAPTCYWCHGYMRQPTMDQDYYGKPGHKPNCKRQRALKLLALPPAPSAPEEKTA